MWLGQIRKCSPSFVLHKSCNRHQRGEVIPQHKVTIKWNFVQALSHLSSGFLQLLQLLFPGSLINAHLNRHGAIFFPWFHNGFNGTLYQTLNIYKIAICMGFFYIIHVGISVFHSYSWHIIPVMSISVPVGKSSREVKMCAMLENERVNENAANGFPDIALL